MRAALAESKRALPACRPNPPVGCVLVKNGNIVSNGFTQPPGGHHAEAGALSKYDGSLVDVTAYVTLEPCSFYGRTPSCATTLIDRRIGKVCVAVRDPDPRNNGKGISMLRSAGVTVVEGILRDEVQAFIEPFLFDG